MTIHEQDFSPMSDYIDFTTYGQWGGITTFTIKLSPELLTHFKSCHGSFVSNHIEQVLLHYIETEKSFFLYLQLSNWQMRNITSGLHLNEQEVNELLTVASATYSVFN